MAWKMDRPKHGKKVTNHTCQDFLLQNNWASAKQLLCDRGYYMSGLLIRYLLNEFNKFQKEWPWMLYSIYMINSNATDYRTKYTCGYKVRLF